MNEEEIIKKYRIELARKGGTATRNKFGSPYFSALAKRSHETRREKKLSTIKHLTATESQSIIQSSNN